MKSNLHVVYKKSPTRLNEVDIHKLSALFEHERGIESFRVLPETIYLEYDSFSYTPEQIEEYLSGTGKKLSFERQSGHLKRHFINPDLRYHKVYSSGKPDENQAPDNKPPVRNNHN